MASSSPSSLIDDPPIPKTDELDGTGPASASQETDDDEVGPDEEMEKVVNRLSELESDNLRQDMDYFISSVENDDYQSSKKYLKLFTSHHCADSFCLIYSSRLTENWMLGSHLIKRFVDSVDDRLDRKLLAYAAPSVVQFCTLLRSRGLDDDDPVYNVCLEKLMWIVVTSNSEELLFCRLRKVVGWNDIFFYVLDLGNKLLKEIGDCLDSSSSDIVMFKGDDCLDMSSVDIVKFKGGDEFCVFVSFVVPGILESVCFEIPIPGRYCRALSSSYFEQLRFLHDLFDELVSKMDLCLAKGDQYLSVKEERTCEFRDVGRKYLDMLNSIYNISKIYQGAGKRVRKMLEKRKDTFTYLVKEYANYDRVHVDEEFNWIFEHKEILDFECRWRMAWKFFPSFQKDDKMNELHIEVDRLRFFDDSCDQINQADARSLQVKEGFSVKFIHEGAFGEGVIREWFTLVCKEMFSPRNALFISNENDCRRFRINPATQVQDRHFEYFRFCGRVIGLALFEKVQVGVTFDNVLFKQLAGLDIQLEDIENTDNTMYKSLTHLLNMNADYVDSDAMGLTFSIQLGQGEVVELIPGGESLKVNSMNRVKYIEKLIYHRFIALTLNQAAHLSEGFSDIFPRLDGMSMFFRCLTLEDFDRVLRGSEIDISVEDWKAHTDCDKHIESSREIVWLWKIIEEMSQEDKRLLLIYWTAVATLPLEGFSGFPERLLVCIDPEAPSYRLPTSLTCFYKLSIPSYPTFEIMKERMGVITQEHVANTFGRG